jgi:hypothetical protein
MVFCVGLDPIYSFASDVFTLLDLFTSTSPSNVYAKFAKTLQFGLPGGSLKVLNKIHKQFAIRLTNYGIRVACGGYGGDGRRFKYIWWVSLVERDHLKNVGRDGRIILK